ncbi:CsbD family protein [Thermopolyspora sp. NPDC052614]|uniref:CsbD family protein n=1 Tax=Thermopolyspora sp. NPDC052614 TaxID=3155682 RepID=UPI00342FEAE0
MGADDKMRNKAEEIGGKAKEGLGQVTGDEEMQAEGKTDQTEGKVKQSGEKIKDAAKKAKDAIKGD